MGNRLITPSSAIGTGQPDVTALSLPAAFGERLSTLYGLVQRSQHVFGSPLGPFVEQARSHHVPRFVYFGPHTSSDSLRLAFLAGFDRRDLRGTLALLHLVEQLAHAPDLGQGLHLSFFPLLDVLGLAGLDRDRRLASTHWGHAPEPEIVLLEQDARVSGYHGFVRIETAPHDDVVVIRLRGAGSQSVSTPGVELISSEDVEPLAVRWETEPPLAVAGEGPLSVADDLPVHPFELTLGIPSTWSAERYDEAVTSILKRFILRYRGLQAYAQHL